METIDYIFGKGGFIILALIVVVVVLIKKYKDWRDFKAPSKKKRK